MKLKEKAMINALLTHFERDESILRFLPEAMQREVALLEKPQKLDFVSMLSGTKWLRFIHYSWFYPILSVMPKKAQMNFFSLFSFVLYIFGFFFSTPLSKNVFVRPSVRLSVHPSVRPSVSPSFLLSSFRMREVFIVNNIIACH